jgi:hypothetical protein
LVMKEGAVEEILWLKPELVVFLVECLWVF